LRHIDEVRDEIAADLFRIDEMRHAETFAPLFLAVIDVDADDHVGAGKAQSLNDIETDAAEAEDDAVRARFDLRRIKYCADAGGDAAADVADLVEGGVLANLCHRDLGQHGEIRERGRAHIVVQFFAVERKTRGAVGHHALTLRRPDRRAQIGLARQAGGALPAFRRIEGDDVVPFLYAGHIRRDIDNDPGTFVTQDCGNKPSGSAPESVKSSVWQIPVAFTSTSTSPAFGPSSSTSVTVSGLPFSNATAARVFMTVSLQAGAGRASTDANYAGEFAPRAGAGFDDALAAETAASASSSSLRLMIRRAARAARSKARLTRGVPEGSLSISCCCRSTMRASSAKARSVMSFRRGGVAEPPGPHRRPEVMGRALGFR